MKKLYFILLLMLPLTAQAQPARKATMEATIWPELQLGYGIGEDGFLFFRNQYRINTDDRYNNLRENGLLSNFERIEFSLGYEHTLTDHWRGGAIVRYAAENFPKTTFYSLFMRHNGDISKLYFNKQLMYEYATQEKQDAYSRFKLTGELGWRLGIKDHFLTPSLSYEVLLRTEFGEGDDTQKQRTIDRTRLRLGLTYEATERFRITPYIVRQTDYFFVEARYDEDNKEIDPAGKYNRVQPIVGLEVKYSIKRPPSTASITY
jgi:hypothetical protein